MTRLAETVGLTRSALSQHLAKLRSAGLVATRRDSRTIYYRLEGEAVVSIMNMLGTIRPLAISRIKRSTLYPDG